MDARNDPKHPDWREEQLRYSILRATYEKAGARCTHSVSAAQIGAGLDVRHEDLFRVVYLLDARQYLVCMGPGPRVCITPKGIEYIEQVAGRRRSLRLPRAA